jgi:hypothetical protein
MQVLASHGLQLETKRCRFADILMADCAKVRKSSRRAREMETAYVNENIKIIHSSLEVISLSNVKISRGYLRDEKDI